MPAATELTWDIAAEDGGARRPSLEDMGGALIEDEVPEPDESMPTAKALNQGQKQAMAVGKVVDSAKITVTFASGVPSVSAAIGPGTAIVPGLFTVVDNGNGDTSITWPTGALPIATCQPTATVNLGVPRFIAAANITDGVRVKSWDSGAVAADAGFTVEVH